MEHWSEHTHEYNKAATLTRVHMHMRVYYNGNGTLTSVYTHRDTWTCLYYIRAITLISTHTLLYLYYKYNIL